MSERHTWVGLGLVTVAIAATVYGTRRAHRLLTQYQTYRRWYTTHDDQPLLQALTGKVPFPPGDWLIRTPIVLASDSTLNGGAEEGAVLHGFSSRVIHVPTGSENVRVENLKIHNATPLTTALRFGFYQHGDLDLKV